MAVPGASHCLLSFSFLLCKVGLDPSILGTGGVGGRAAADKLQVERGHNAPPRMFRAIQRPTGCPIPTLFHRGLIHTIPQNQLGGLSPHQLKVGVNPIIECP